MPIPSFSKTPQAKAQADALRRLALVANTVGPKTTYAGVLFYEFDTSCKEIVLKAPIAGSVFEIPFQTSEVAK